MLFPSSLTFLESDSFQQDQGKRVSGCGRCPNGKNHFPLEEIFPDSMKKAAVQGGTGGIPGKIPGMKAPVLRSGSFLVNYSTFYLRALAISVATPFFPCRGMRRFLRLLQEMGSRCHFPSDADWPGQHSATGQRQPALSAGACVLLRYWLPSFYMVGAGSKRRFASETLMIFFQSVEFPKTSLVWRIPGGSYGIC